MARVNVYLSDELAAEAKASGLNISKVTQDAIRATLARAHTDSWLDDLDRAPRVEVSSERVIEAIDAARAELGEHAGR